MRRAFLLVLAVAAIVVPSAAGKGEPVFPLESARTGDWVVLSTPFASPRTHVRVYFMPLAVSPRFWRTYQAFAPAYGPPPKVRAARFLGELQPAGDYGVTLAFRVPKVAPGRYVLGYWCVPCDTHWTSALPNYQPSPRGILRVRG
jgi:hypothetical protein